MAEPKRGGGRRAVTAQPVLHSVRGLSMLGFHKIAIWEWGASNPGPPVICVHGLTPQPTAQ